MPTKERFRLTLRSVCFAILLTATVFRLCSEIPWQSAGRGFQKAALLLGFGLTELPESTEPLAQTEKDYAKLEYQPPEHLPETQWNETDAELVHISNRAGADIDPAALMAQPINFDLTVDGPLILVTHTHATEAYTMTADTQYNETSAYRTDDTDYNVVRVGQALTDRLNELGIETIHDTVLHDLNGYNDAYERTEEAISAYLAQYPSIQMVIDVHRDAVEDNAGKQLALTATLEGEEAARLLLVMGTDLGGLEHPNWRGNLAFALKLQTHCEKAAPGLFRDLSLRGSRFNEHLTPNSVLLEVGTAGNTLPQAICSAEFFAGELAELLQGK